MDNIDKSLEELRDQIDRFKEYGVDKCFIPSIYVHTYEIAKLIKKIDEMPKNTEQMKIVDELDKKLFAQFRRLSEGRCKCSISKE